MPGATAAHPVADMLVMKMLRWGIGALILSAVTVAQVGPGGKAPAPTFTKWLHGEPVAVGTAAAPACTVFVFHARTPELLAGDGDYLADLQRRFRERGLRVVAVVADEQAADLTRWPGCAVALDPDAVTDHVWVVANGDRRFHVVVLDHAGTVAFVGLPGAGLVDEIEHVLADSVDLEAAAAAQRLRLSLPANFDDLAAADALRAIRPALAYAPRDGWMNGLAYLCHATKSNDAEAARRYLSKAIEALAGEARPLAVFADLALRGDPRREGLVEALLGPLAAAAAAAPADQVVQLAYLRALVSAGDGRQFGRQAMRVRKLVMATATGCLDFAAMLTRDQNPQIHLDLATIALDRAAALGATPRLLTAARYSVALRCGEDRDRATRLMDEYLQDQELRVGINNDSWYLMTRLPTMGRYDWFACGLVERMLEQRDAMDYFEFDTAALAMFLVGRNAEAVELQEQALAKGGADNPEYIERLARYKASSTPAPR